MQLSGFLDIAVTLVSAFVLTSLLCTTINELVATLLKTRAKTLHRTLHALVDDPNIRAAFFDHGLIKSLATGSSSGKSGTNPSYIDGRTFADALLGALAQGAPIPGVDELQGRIDSLPAGKLKDALAVALASARLGATNVRDEIALWFDNSMDRLSGYYTRYMKWLSLLVGFVVAAGLNIDAVDLTKASWSESVRATAMSIVENYDPSKHASCGEGEAQISCLISSVADTARTLNSLPVGWKQFPPALNEIGWLQKLIGWLITALAASVGAPFWFDVLQNVMSLRGAGVKRVEPQAAQKDK